MRKLTSNDRNWGPFTFGPWTTTFSIALSSAGDDEDHPGETCNKLWFIGFGWVLQIRLPGIIRPWRIKHVAESWDAETVKRLGRNWYYEVHERTYGFSLSNMGNGYDFLQIYLGPQTHDSSTTKSWCTHLPWKQWRHVRFSLYDLKGDHFWTEPESKRGMSSIREQMDMEERCPKAHFGFEDYDGELIVATTHMEEREWKFGTGWFKWLSLFLKPKVRRPLDLQFSAEVGPQKGSWKGGTLSHGIDVQPGEDHEKAFRRYCAMDHERKGRKFSLRFIGPCGPPPKKPQAAEVAGDYAQVS